MSFFPARLITRRRALWLGVSLPVPLIVACGGSDSTPDTLTSASAESTGGGSTETTTASGATATLPPTPACTDDDEPTVAQTEGPYFTPNSPERTSLLEAGMPGTTLVLTGRVANTSCQPVARALLDFWQCDDGGEYDNSGYRLRGHQFRAEDWTYRLETIVPGLYPGRTRHIHVKVQAPNEPVLTTQLYFPGEARNRQDGIYDDALVMETSDSGSGKAGAFDFVLDV